MDVRTDCVVVNLDLPDGSGPLLTQRLRESRPGLKCIHVTEHPKEPIPELAEVPLVYKSSGQALLLAELMKALRSASEGSG